MYKLCERKNYACFTFVCSDHIQVEDFKPLPANVTVLIRVYIYIVFLCSGTDLPCVADSSAAAHLMLDTRWVFIYHTYMCVCL